MASVNVYTAEHTDDVFDEDIVDGDVVGNNLILTKRSGATVDAGNVRGPTGAAGTNGSNVRLWDQATAYAVGDVVGYSGRLYKALVAATNKCPPLFQTNWQPISGKDLAAFPSQDPFFEGDILTTAWETFWKTGTSTVSITSTAGEFETMGQGCKVVLGASSSQRLYEKAEVLVNAGDVLQIRARVKLSVTAPQFTLECQLLQNDKNNPPDPLSTGLTVTGLGAQAATNGWTWLTWTVAVVDAKPRAKINFIPQTTAVGGATVFIDRVEIEKVSINAGSAIYRSVTMPSNLNMLTSAQLPAWTTNAGGRSLPMNGGNTQMVVSVPGTYKVTSSCTFQQSGGAGSIWYIVSVIHRRAGVALTARDVVTSTPAVGLFAFASNEMTVEALAGDTFEVALTCQYASLANAQGTRCHFDAILMR